MARARLLPLILFAATAAAVMATGSGPAAWGDAATPSCAQERVITGTTTTTTPGGQSPTAGTPCWTDVEPYPFGADGTSVAPAYDASRHPVDASGNPARTGAGASGALGDPTCNVPASSSSWPGDFLVNSQSSPTQPPCYLQVTSMAFRAWNRGLAALTFPSDQAFLNDSPTNFYGGSNPFGVWLWNGRSWFPDPSFPGSATCPGSQVLWAGKLDYWLIGPSLDPHQSASAVPPQQVLCHFNGTLLRWEALSLPAASLARLPSAGSSGSEGGITSGACFAYNNCWFFGTDGIIVHWDGASLVDASESPSFSPWLLDDFTGAVVPTDPVTAQPLANAGGQPVGVAVTRSTYLGEQNPSGPPASQPDGSLPPQVYASVGGAFAPQPLITSCTQKQPPYIPADPKCQDPVPPDLTGLATDPQGDIWTVGYPDASDRGSTQPYSAVELTPQGQPSCSASLPAQLSPTQQSIGQYAGYTGGLGAQLAVFPSSGGQAYPGAPAGGLLQAATDNSAQAPALTTSVCGATAAATPITEPYIPNPITAYDGEVPTSRPGPIPADLAGAALSVIANAGNDAWAATSSGFYGSTIVGKPSSDTVQGPLAPHLYRWTDGNPPGAPAGDNSEVDPSLFALQPPVYAPVPQALPQPNPAPPPVSPPAPAPQVVKEKPAVYDVRSRHLLLLPGGRYELEITFALRRPVTLGAVAVRGRKVVARSGLHHFAGSAGVLKLIFTRRNFPTGVRFVYPQ